MSKKNIFAKFQDYVNKPKRNVFDLSFGNNLTTKFGQLTPVFCKECIPGDSFKIHSKFALQFMPMKFPIQTPMKAYLHFFYVRNRTLYKDWMDFIGGTKDNLTMPYVQPVDKEKFYRVGGLADYLGVPNVVYGSYGREFTSEQPTFTGYYAEVTNAANTPYVFNKLYGYKYLSPSVAPLFAQSDTRLYNVRDTLECTAAATYASNVKSALVGHALSDYLEDSFDTNAAGNIFAKIAAANNHGTISNAKVSPCMCIGSIDIPANVNAESEFVYKFGNLPTGSTNGHPYDSFFACYVNDNGVVVGFTHINVENSTPTSPFPVYRGTFGDLISGEYGSATKIYFFHHGLIPYAVNSEGTITFSVNEFDNKSIYNDSELKVVYDVAGTNVIGTDALSSTPYDNQIHLNALPFRAYEAIYNSYYRNPQNNPYILNGVAEYNKYIPTYDGGSDTTQYDLHQRNWEYDFLTSAVQSPQQGDIAPLVGISMTGEATFQDDNGNVYYASAQYNENGEITGWTSHSPDMPQGSLRLLMDMAGTGISINDLRNVNAFQKFLENNIRRGLKYRDQIKSHFGVDVRYDELDMPEFIGGCSTVVDINKLSQTSESGDTPMGSFVGQGSAYGESKHDITHYCDEHGFIIGILSVVPVPVYSQLLPKYFIKNSQLDYYFPEFGHIGYQPILQKEVSPLQTYYAGDDLNAVFGYNRSWYDYLDSTDEVHAQFRTTMRDFIMNRTFDEAPELSESFLLVDPDQLNEVFLAGTDDNDIYAPEADKIIGSMYFEVSKKSPIPLFGIPKLD